MPIFDYKCSKCASEFELMVKASDEPKCPNCESEEITKQISATRQSGIKLMGEGFYKKSPSSW